MGKKASKPPQQEFERKFLAIVPKLPKDLPPPEHIFTQGYLRKRPLQERIRFVDDRVFLQYKGPNSYESEAIPMPTADAEYLLDHFRLEDSILVRKEWRSFPSAFDGLKWELHTFLDENEGLVEVEIEYPTEVTDDPRFKSKNLAFRWFRAWPEEERREVFRMMGL